MITIKSNRQEILKSMHKMPAFIREAVALVVLTFFFLVLELQIQVSRFRQLLLLQHLKKLRRKQSGSNQSMPINRLILIIDEQSIVQVGVIIDCHRFSLIGIDFH